MTKSTLRKWEQALLKWEVWVDYVNDTKDEVLERHPNLEELVAKGKPKYITKKSGQNLKLIRKTNNYYDLLSDLYNRVKDAGRQFIIGTFKLDSASTYHQLLLEFWMACTVPELYREFDPTAIFFRLDKEIALTEIIPHSKPANRNGKSVIVDSISWIRGEISPKEAAEQLLEVKWPKANEVITRSSGGRPPKDSERDIEAIICCILRYKYKESFEDIADKFDWSIYPDSQEKPMSNTLINRLKRGRQLIRKNGIPIDLPTHN